MHKSRSSRQANQARRDRAAKLQKPLPLAQQREIAEARAAERHDERERLGQNYPTYDGTPSRQISIRKLLKMNPDIFGGLFDEIMKALGNNQHIKVERSRGNRDRAA